jgi:hypothetical protein
VLNRADLMMLANHLAEALGTLHQADIVHRDVSPGNILIRSRHNGGARRGSLERGDVTLLEPGERFLLADLGHAKDLVLASGFTAGGGTRGFAAPEQRDDVTVVDRRADIFSATAIIEWAAHDGRFADTLEPFFDVGLAAEPEERFDSMAQWHAELSNAIGTGNSSPSRSRFGRQRTSRPDPLAEVRAESRISPALEAAVEFAVGAEGRRQRTAPVIRAAKGLATVVLMAALATTALYALEAAPFNPVDDRLDDTSADADSPPVVTGPGGGRGLPAPPTVDEETAQSALVVPGTDVEPGQHPWVALDQPMDGEVIDGDLVLSGTAEFERGIGHVELTLENLTNDTWWDGTAPSFGALRTTVDVEIEDTLLVNGLPVRGGFEVVVPEDVLQSGLHEIRLWARGLQNEGPAEPVVRVVVVP